LPLKFRSALPIIRGEEAKWEDSMEIGPIEAIRPVGKVLRSRPDSALDRVFASEFRREEQDPSQMPVRRASRGLEDETPDDDPGDQQLGSGSAYSDASISIFA
jgi:hypothetical protein